MKKFLIALAQVLLIGMGITFYTVANIPWWMDLIGVVMLMIGLDWRYGYTSYLRGYNDGVDDRAERVKPLIEKNHMELIKTIKNIKISTPKQIRKAK